jgi:hypothetical protein
MSSAPSSFRKNDVKRMVEALRTAGVKLGRIELCGNKIALIPSGAETGAQDSSAGDLEHWLESRGK